MYSMCSAIAPIRAEYSFIYNMPKRQQPAEGAGCAPPCCAGATWFGERVCAFNSLAPLQLLWGCWGWGWAGLGAFGQGEGGGCGWGWVGWGGVRLAQAAAAAVRADLARKAAGVGRTPVSATSCIDEPRRSRAPAQQSLLRGRKAALAWAAHRNQERPLGADLHSRAKPKKPMAALSAAGQPAAGLSRWSPPSSGAVQRGPRATPAGFTSSQAKQRGSCCSWRGERRRWQRQQRAAANTGAEICQENWPPNWPPQPCLLSVQCLEQIRVPLCSTMRR